MNQVKIISLLLLLSYTSILVAQEKTALETFIEKEQLQPSPIASISIKKVDLDIRFGEVVEVTETLLSFDSFNTQGNQVEKSTTHYNSDGNVSSQTKYKYDDQGNQIEKIAMTWMVFYTTK